MAIGWTDDSPIASKRLWNVLATIMILDVSTLGSICSDVELISGAAQDLLSFCLVALEASLWCFQDSA